MSDGAGYTIEDRGEGAPVLALHGPYRVSSIGAIDDELQSLDGPFSAVDMSGINEIDTVGAWVACSLARDHGTDVTGASERAERLMAAVDTSVEDMTIAAPRETILKRVPATVGGKVFEMGEGVKSTIAFLGRFILALGSLIRHPRRFRWLALIRQSELVGVDALAIIGLMSFLIGIVIAQQGSVQLAQFGAETLTVNLVGRITLRELGVLMTAIMVAGRSGSAFAAQIGTMKLTEEIDAMRTIGISPMEALVVPRVMAAVLMMPLLGFFASVMAIIGGAVIADITLGIPFYTFLVRIKEVVPMYDLYVGMIKAPVFGLIIGMTGCYQGMLVSGDSEQVGLRTTKAVVQAIFAVIVVDAFFAVFFTEIGWG